METLEGGVTCREALQVILWKHWLDGTRDLINNILKEPEDVVWENPEKGITYRTALKAILRKHWLFITNALINDILKEKYFEDFRKLYGKKGYNYANYNGQYRIQLVWTTYYLKENLCDPEYAEEMYYYGEIVENYKTEESFDFSTGKLYANGRTLTLTKDEYQEKADMILKKIKEAIEAGNSKRKAFIRTERG